MIILAWIDFALQTMTYGVSNVGSTIHRCKYEKGGDFPDYLLKLVLKAYHRVLGEHKFDIIIFVPPTKSGTLVQHFAEKLSAALNIPISCNLVKTRDIEAQKIFENSLLKKDNVADAFAYAVPDEIAGKNILLVDDVFDSGATVKEIGRILSDSGAQMIAPLVIAKTVGGDHI